MIVVEGGKNADLEVLNKLNVVRVKNVQEALEYIQKGYIGAVTSFAWKDEVENFGRNNSHAIILDSVLE